MNKRARISSFIYLFIFCFSISSNIYAQNSGYVPGELIIQTDHSPISEILSSIGGTDRSSSNINKKTILESMGLYTIRFDPEKVDEYQVLNELRNHENIISAQFNHYLSSRRKPNDPLYHEQWSFFNDGSLGGIAGKDISIENAWNITTGGKVGNKYDIVVAVIDDGFNIDHPDLMDNIFINSGEIRNNQKDDDNNGYIDDYKGWNFQTDNDSIDTGNHGNPVAGIIGASGNNDIGISGINWSVRILPLLLDYDFTEAGLLASYIYAYKMRKLFNESNGETGAFVAVTNSSWGVSGYFPDEFPVWCNVYDTLNTVGIINCVATDNSIVDVDDAGDLPSLCSSESLIVVTNTDDQDRLSGGYGPLNVDVAAPAENIYTLKNQGYGTDAGTSFAAPVASGIVALMYSVPSAILASEIITNPQKTAQTMRQLLLRSYDPISELEGKIQSPGRLNAEKAVYAALEFFGLNNDLYCHIDSIEGPHEIWIDTFDFAEESFASGDNLGYKPTIVMADSVEQGRFIDVRLKGPDAYTDSLDFAIWLDSNEDSLFTQNELLLYERDLSVIEQRVFIPENIDSGYYNLRVAITEPTDSINACGEGIDDYEYEDYSLYVKLNPLLCPDPPLVDTLMIGDTSATIIWEMVDSSVAYIFRYRAMGSNEWEDEMVDTAKMFELNGLQQCTPYEFQVRSVCYYDTSAYTLSYEFMTDCQTSNEQQDIGNEISIYPNPLTSDIITIKIPQQFASGIKPILISVYNVGGKEVYQNPFRPISNTIPIDLSHLTGGVYFIRISNGEKFGVKKLVVK
ncbi:S8 family serine peptidase [Membranihabitans maritimus]|uniref:S8 family serine peptidase n=1 Tax=Membranihabitans maritimus TaxID=2904244 RepID=UPI001EFFADDA|nr:S8 family serine peptidase [Membranihabitans maritimus]